MASIFFIDFSPLGIKQSSTNFAEYMKRPETLAEYISRIMRESDFSYSDVVRRAERKGYKITQSYLSKIVNEAAGNVSVEKLKAVAAGLEKPEEEVFAVASGTVLQIDDIEDSIIKAIAFGYVPAGEAAHADYEVEAFTRRHAATRIDGAAVDPERKKILS